MIAAKTPEGVIRIGRGVFVEHFERGVVNPPPSTKRGKRRHDARRPDAKNRAEELWSKQ